MPRRASFSGSVNSMQFLNDATGSRRFLCFEATSINYSNPVDYNGIYSQALHLLKSGSQYWLDKDDIELDYGDATPPPLKKEEPTESSKPPVRREAPSEAFENRRS